jgi:hypothetical protein
MQITETKTRADAERANHAGVQAADRQAMADRIREILAGAGVVGRVNGVTAQRLEAAYLLGVLDTQRAAGNEPSAYLTMLVMCGRQLTTEFPAVPKLGSSSGEVRALRAAHPVNAPLER